MAILKNEYFGHIQNGKRQKKTFRNKTSGVNDGNNNINNTWLIKKTDEPTR